MAKDTANTYEFDLYSPFWDHSETLTIEADDEDEALARAEDEAPHTYLVEAWTCPDGSSVSRLIDRSPTPVEVEVLVEFGGRHVVWEVPGLTFDAVLDAAENLAGDLAAVVAVRAEASTVYFGKDVRSTLAGDPTVPPSWR